LGAWNNGRVTEKGNLWTSMKSFNLVDRMSRRYLCFILFTWYDKTVSQKLRWYKIDRIVAGIRFKKCFTCCLWRKRRNSRPWRFPSWKIDLVENNLKLILFRL
jgi:hypothetical protein